MQRDRRPVGAEPAGSSVIFPVTPAIRSELRRLKSEFDLAFSRLENAADRDSPDYRAARDAYGLWRVAIDKFGVPLLDTLDAMETEAAGPHFGMPSIDTTPQVEPLTAEQQADVLATFHDIDQLGEIMRLLDESA